MRPEDCVGRTGRTLTEVANSGTVEVAGESFDAMTVGPPIPAGEGVEVTGWRLVDGARRVLSVRVPRPGEPLGVPPPQRAPTAEERLDELERLCAELRRPGRAAGGPGWLLLTFGQIVSVLVCLATPIYAIISLTHAASVRGGVAQTPDASAWGIMGAILVFGHSAAMAVVFSRVKQLPPLD